MTNVHAEQARVQPAERDATGDLTRRLLICGPIAGPLAAFLVSLVGLVGSCFVFARRFASLRQRGWAVYCVATAVAAPILVALSNAMMTSGRGGLPLFGLAIVMSAWIALLAARLLADPPDLRLGPNAGSIPSGWKNAVLHPQSR